MSVIYCIVNNAKSSRPKYYGRAKKYKQRVHQHKHRLRDGDHHNAHLQRAWRKYGESSFSFHVLHRDLSIEEAKELEQHYLDNEFRADVDYNICMDSSGGAPSAGIIESHRKRKEDILRFKYGFSKKEASKLSEEVRYRGRVREIPGGGIDFSRLNYNDVVA